MSTLQKAMFLDCICGMKLDEFHHGDCVGADAQAHALVRQWHPRCSIIIHPPTNTSKRAYCSGDKYMRSAVYLTRNKQIVACSDSLIAAPSLDVEKLRSGTWSTVRFARKVGLEILILKR